MIAICGDVMHSRVARSNILLLNTMGARVRVVAPSTLLPRGIERMGVEVARDMREGLEWRRYRDDAAAAARAHERLVRAVEPASTSTISASTRRSSLMQSPTRW